MKGSAVPYLTFYGHGKEAADFYAKVFELEQRNIQKYGDADFPSPPEAADYLLHCHLQKGEFQIMLADSVDKQPESRRHGLSLTVQCENEEEAQRIYDGLRAEGEVLMELQEMFWGAKFGKVRDKFGFVWDLNCEKEE
ncbi:VOC family protein [Sporosarcina sp. FSL K6-2383]|uniref:VOC family protein n=1 Tax=Sporosarcina sp. FSL K6-2383 TaxID=2921556 RepID=UPI0031599FE4